MLTLLKDLLRLEKLRKFATLSEKLIKIKTKYLLHVTD